MKNRENNTVLRSRPLQILILSMMGLILLPPQMAGAENEDGKVRAKKDTAAVMRDPFCPVGYEPKQVYSPSEPDAPVRPKVKAPGGIDWDEAMKQVAINGVSNRSTDEYIAVINNAVKSVGDHVSIEYAGVKYTWKVESITPPGSVKLRRHAAE